MAKPENSTRKVDIGYGVRIAYGLFARILSLYKFIDWGNTRNISTKIASELDTQPAVVNRAIEYGIRLDAAAKKENTRQGFK